MATTSDRRNAAGAGGKIMRNRRVPPSSRTPYSRPTKPLEPSPSLSSSADPENPNWLSGLIYPAKMIASGAGKILSFFGPDSSSSSSSGDSSENDEDEDEVENDTSFEGDELSNKVLPLSSKSDNKRAIVQLVMQETFSRDEGNELIKLIKSRVVDTNGTFGESSPIRIARNWLQEKRSGSKKRLEDELDTTNLATSSQVTRNEKGSPVDMAKSYMQSRPAWASPSLKHIDFGSPPPSGMRNMKEETPKSTLRSSELKRSSFSSGSWNILEEIRRVRAKATEELLAATPLTKIALSSLSPANNPSQASLPNNRDVEEAAPVGSTHAMPQSVLPDTAATPPPRVNQDGDAVQSMEHQDPAESESNKDKEVIELGTAAENGFTSAAISLSAVQDAATEKPSPPEEENGNPGGSSSQGGGLDDDVDMEDNLDDLNPSQEPTSTDDPTFNPNTDIAVNGSQNSSSVHLEEELSQEFSQPTTSELPSKAKAKANDTQIDRRTRGYSRRGRGRGRGK